MHNRERIEVTREWMRGRGYRYMTKLGWNHVFELEDGAGEETANDQK
jgi:hypothetical protein